MTPSQKWEGEEKRKVKKKRELFDKLVSRNEVGWAEEKGFFNCRLSRGERGREKGLSISFPSGDSLSRWLNGTGLLLENGESGHSRIYI